jgi:hypothetical protein
MTAVLAGAGAPDVREVARITAISNRVIRNLEITHCYSRLSAAMAERTGGCSNWCTISTWASRQAGATIRGEDLLEHLQRRLNRRAELLHPVRSTWRFLLRKGVFQPETRIGRLVRAIHTPFDAFERTSEAVARGNLKVFSEIGREFARYLSECPRHLGVDSVEFGRFLDRLAAGDPPDGQEYLRRAFTRYQQQAFEPSATARAELIALANIEISFHEQTRLQPEIREALDAPLATARDLTGGTRRRRLWRLVAPVVVSLAAPLHRFWSALAREVITECLMVLSLPGPVIFSLARHLDLPTPESLRTPKNEAFVEFIGRFEPSPPDRDDCGATDWSDLPQRMHYVSHLFRALHERADLFTVPFNAEQVSVLASGRLPEGPL